MSGYVLEARDIKVSFKKENQKTLFGRERQEVLHGVSLHLARGECLGVIGESGSGKSTLGRVLAGLLKPDAGSVTLDGLDVYARHGREEKHRLQHRLSIVFQDYSSSANPRFRVEHIIGESLRALEISTGKRYDRRARISELLERVGLGPQFMRRYPHELSGGQLQRVCIARAIAVEPGVILLDEAISSLDASTQIQVMDLLMDLRAAHGLSYLFITHDLAAVTYMCDRVLFFHGGRVVEEARDTRRIAELENDYARQLLGSVMGLGLDGGYAGKAAHHPDPVSEAAGVAAPACPRVA